MINAKFNFNTGSKSLDSIIKYYNLKAGSKVLDVGCGKGYLLFEMLLIEPGLKIYGTDISHYAIKNSKPEILFSRQNFETSISLAADPTDKIFFLLSISIFLKSDPNFITMPL